MASKKDIQRRIKSVSNTKKLTRAMEMVSAAKMRKSVEAVLRTRTYANLSWETVLNLSRSSSGNGASSHPLLVKRDKLDRAAIILISSNRGLCGGFNSNIIEKAHLSIKKHHEFHGKEFETDFILIGKKGEAVYRYYGYNIAAEFTKLDIVDDISEVVPAAKMILKDYLSGKYDRVFVAYTDFVSASKQVPRVKQILPVEIERDDQHLGIVGEDTRVGTSKEFLEVKEGAHLSDEQFVYEYTFEPSPREVLDEMIPRLVEVQLFQAVLESNASEHSARMAAMHQATDAAKTMVEELTLFYNKARQAAITAEIAEISAGANALK